MYMYVYVCLYYSIKWSFVLLLSPILQTTSQQFVVFLFAAITEILIDMHCYCSRVGTHTHSDILPAILKVLHGSFAYGNGDCICVVWRGENEISTSNTVFSLFCLLECMCMRKKKRQTQDESENFVLFLCCVFLDFKTNRCFKSKLRVSRTTVCFIAC